MKLETILCEFGSFGWICAMGNALMKLETILGSIHLLAKLWQPFCKLPFRGLSQNFGAIILATYFGNLFWHAKLWQLFVKKNGNLFWHAKLWQEKWQLIFWHAKLWQLKFGKKNGIPCFRSQ